MTDADDQGLEAEEAPDIAALQKKIAELEKDNKKYRDQHRRAEFVSKYGEAIADEVADLPEDKRESWAEKLKALQSSVPPEPTEPAPAEPPKVEEPAGLAAVAAAPAAGTPEGQTMTPEEFKEHVDELGLLEASRRYGPQVRFPNIDNPLATGQAPQMQGTYRPPS